MQAFLSALVDRFEELEGELNTLDAATGDGDHGTTILKGLRAASESPNAPDKAFRKAAGGASGSLFALLIGALNGVANQDLSLPDALGKAAERIGMIGQATAGDKTMLDALIPASKTSNAADAAQAAREGRDSTRDMAAKRGRAQYVEAAGLGHIDAGATSVAEILELFAQHTKANP